MERKLTPSQRTALAIQANAMLVPFFTGRGSAPAVTAAAPKRPAPEMAVAK